jgi:hypothetical protein
MVEHERGQETEENVAGAMNLSKREWDRFYTGSLWRQGVL